MPDSSVTQVLPKHPSPELLFDFIAGALDDDQARSVELHLASCEECVAVLDQQSRRDPFVERVQNAGVKQPSADRTETSEQTFLGYEILGELGRGGMGVVYRARDRRLKREVALKVLLASEHATGAQRERFRLEAETVAALRHPGIVQIYEVGEHDGRAYMALELVQGGGLQNWMKHEQRTLQHSAAMLLQLARTMHFAHQRGIVHRDLKPENILLVEPSGTLNASNSNESWWNSGITTNSGVTIVVPAARITDFGLAKQIDSDSSLTKTGVLMGTPNYMAPEQAAGNGRHVGPAADIHALGCILYEMLVGRPPFVSKDIFRTIAMVMSDDPVSPRELRREVPPDLETICLKCLMKNPDERYASAQALADDLELFLRGEPIRAHGLALGYRLFRWARQKPTLATALAGLIGFYLLHLFVMLVLNVERNRVIHWPLTGVFAWLAVTLFPMQRLLESDRWRTVGYYAHLLQGVLSASFVLALDRGPSSAPVPIFLLFILAGALWSMSPQVVWVTTIASCVGYAWLVLSASWFRPNDQVPPDTAIGFELCLIIAGWMMHLMLRRMHSGNSMKDDTIQE